jgi:CheY-like chemotaxis protein
LHDHPDLVLVDVNMPGLRGQDIVSVARSRGDLGNTRVLLFSTESEATLEALATECGADGWIRKTADSTGFLEQIRTWTERPTLAESAPHSPTILFVDPDEGMHAYYREAFSCELSQMEFASSGDEALHRLEAGPAPELVVSEVSLPGISGADVYHRMVERDAALRDRFLFVTGAASSHSWVAEFINELESRVLHKPVSRERLRDEVAKRLGRHD